MKSLCYCKPSWLSPFYTSWGSAALPHAPHHCQQPQERPSFIIFVILISPANGLSESKRDGAIQRLFHPEVFSLHDVKLRTISGLSVSAAMPAELIAVGFLSGTAVTPTSICRHVSSVEIYHHSLYLRWELCWGLRHTKSISAGFASDSLSSSRQPAVSLSSNSAATSLLA